MFTFVTWKLCVKVWKKSGKNPANPAEIGQILKLVIQFRPKWSKSGSILIRILDPIAHWSTLKI